MFSLPHDGVQIRKIVYARKSVVELQEEMGVMHSTIVASMWQKAAGFQSVEPPDSQIFFA